MEAQKLYFAIVTNLSIQLLESKDMPTLSKKFRNGDFFVRNPIYLGSLSPRWDSNIISMGSIFCATISLGFICKLGKTQCTLILVYAKCK